MNNRHHTLSEPTSRHGAGRFNSSLAHRKVALTRANTET